MAVNKEYFRLWYLLLSKTKLYIVWGGDCWRWAHREIIPHSVIRRSFTDGFSGISEGSKGTRYAALWTNTISGRGNSKYKNPALRTYFPKKSSKNSVTEAEWRKRRLPSFHLKFINVECSIFLQDFRTIEC